MADKKKWLGDVAAKMKAKGTKGLFTKKAKAAGESVRQYAIDKYSAPGTLGKEARFAYGREKH